MYYEMLEAALRSLILNHSYLLESGLCERCISHQLAVEIKRQEMDNLDVDVEYNRVKLEGFDLAKTGIKGNRVFPDVVIHKRGRKDFNKCAIELKIYKKNHSVCKSDVAKLREYKSMLGYENSYFISLTREVGDKRFVITTI